MDERDVILDFIHSEHDGEGLCTGYILVATLTIDDDTDRLWIYPEPGQSIVVGVGLLETAATHEKSRFVTGADNDD